MDTLERIVFGMKDMESRFDMLGRIRRKFKHMLPEEYPTYRSLAYSYLRDLEKYPEIYKKISDGMQHITDILTRKPKNTQEHKRIMSEYISALKKVNNVLFEYFHSFSISY